MGDWLEQRFRLGVDLAQSQRAEDGELHTFKVISVENAT
jgi:hypothetical protein